MEFIANSINQLAQGTILFNDNEPLRYILMVIKGKVEIASGGVRMTLGAGSFLGLNGLENNTHIGTCRAIDQVSVYPFRAVNSESVSRILAANKDYNGIALYYQNRLITEMSRNYKEMLSYAGSMYSELKDQYDKYLSLAKSSGCRVTMLSKVSELKEYAPGVVPNAERIQYYTEFSRVPLDAIKQFYTNSAYMTRIHLSEQTMLISELYDACKEILDYLEAVFALFIASSENSLFRQEMSLAIEMKSKGDNASAIDSMIEANLENLTTIGDFLKKRTGSTLQIDSEELLHFHDCYKRGEAFEDNSDSVNVSSDIASMISELVDSEKQLVEFSGISEEQAESFYSTLNAFIALPDKENQDDSTRKLRKKASEVFYMLYKAVFKKAYFKSKLPTAVELFLSFGYVSEKLLDEKLLAEILAQRQPEQCGECKVYTIKEWLTLIYEGKKEPSRNDMGQDFQEYLRELKKQKEIDDAKEQELMEDGNYKLDFEIKNLFMSANRVVNGQLTLFVPWLHSGMFMGSVGKSFVDRARVNNTYDDILKIDYSIFHRETLYTDPVAGIDREYEQKKVPPVFILFPTVGLNGCMWQEITGRKRDTEARFCLPLFTYNNLNDLCIKVFGQFRWAMCKTIQGTNWNNIQIHSLTSEYSDYIQFYKKNHALSDDRKEKLKLQIQRGRNNLREVFTLDYIAWINNEANGAVRMNKVAREILATYCPFAYDIRMPLLKQPLYEEAFARGLRERAKKVREMELRFKGLERKDIEIPKPLKYTLEFYRAF